MIDVSYPAVPVQLAIGPPGAALAAAPSVAEIAHRVVTVALAAGDAARAELTARLAYELLAGRGERAGEGDD